MSKVHESTCQGDLYSPEVSPFGLDSEKYHTEKRRDNLGRDRARISFPTVNEMATVFD